MTLDEFIDKVAERTSGTQSDPLTREEVDQVVRATFAVLEEQDTTPAFLLHPPE